MKKLAFCSLACISLFAFEHQPWFNKIMEFEFRPSYTWRHFNTVQNGFNPTSYSSTDQCLQFELGVSPWPTIDVQLEMNFADTRMHSWSYLSVGGYLRYLFWDDVAGDPISWSVGGSLRGVNGHFLDDVSIPYHANLNLEIDTVIGKEFDELYNWVFRTWGLFGFGIGNRGAPYLKALAHIETKIKDTHQFTVFGDSLWGLGGQEKINVRQFQSYANVHHQSIDIGALYRYHFKLYGALSASYAYRVFAHNFPEHAHTLRFEYRLPFSIL